MENHILELSKKLMTIPSVKGNSAAMNRVLKITEKELVKFKFREFVQNGSKSLIFYNQKTFPKKFKFILNAHLDVVSAKPEQYTPKIKDGKLYGRGALDMKAPAAAEILAFKEMAGKVTYPIGLQIVTDEEVGGHNGTGYQIEKGVRAGFVIAGEYTNLKINNRAKGPLWIKVTAEGKTSHGAYVWNGDNAIQKMILFIQEMNQLYPIPKKESWVTTQNLGKIETTNETLNKVPDNCSAYFDIRRIPEEKGKVLKNVKKILPKDFELTVLEDEPVQYAGENDPFIIKLKESIQNITKKKADFVNFHGASDARFYNTVGTPAICFGPIGEGLHTDNEWIDIESLNTYYRILTDYILSLDK